jgi:hypothetical protein
MFMTNFTILGFFGDFTLEIYFAFWVFLALNYTKDSFKMF